MSVHSESIKKENTFTVEGRAFLKNDGLHGDDRDVPVIIKANKDYFVIWKQSEVTGWGEFARVFFRDIQMQPYGNSDKNAMASFLVTYTKGFQKEFLKDNPHSAMAYLSFVLNDATLVCFFKESLTACCWHHVRSFIRFHKILLLSFLSLVGALIAAYFNVDLLVNAFVSDKMAREMGEKVIKSHPFVQAEVCLDSKNSDAIVAIENAFSKTSYGLKPTIRVIHNNDVNAFALPGGLIYVHSELIKKAENADELVGVLAHEYGHAVHKHSLLVFVKISIIEYFTNLFFGSDSIANIFTVMEGLRYSREVEREADATALKVLKELNVSYAGLKTFFHRIENLSHKDKNRNKDKLVKGGDISKKNQNESRNKFRVPGFLLTHPHIEDRIRNIPQEVEHNTKPLLNESEFADLKKKTTQCIAHEETVIQKIKDTFKKKRS